MPKVPEYIDPTVAAAVLEARQVETVTEDQGFAIEWLIEHSGMSLDSATRAIEDKTFRYRALYPEGHPGLEALNAEQRSRGRRAYQLKKLRPQVIDRDGGRCQGCQKRVEGREATLDHIDPEGPGSLENLHLLCQGCNALKGKMNWVDFQAILAHVKDSQESRPDFVCQRTGLSVRGHSWRAVGCENPPECLWLEVCFVSTVTRRKACLCEDDGDCCPPWCPGCPLCFATVSECPRRGAMCLGCAQCWEVDKPHGGACKFVSDVEAEHGFDFTACETPVACRTLGKCGKALSVDAV